MLKYHPDKVNTNNDLTTEEKEKMITLFRTFNHCDNHKDKIKSNGIDCKDNEVSVK